MNHNYAHCLDYKKGKCLKTKCFRAELVEDLKNYIGNSSIVTWASLRGTKYCEMEWQENRMDDLISRQAAVNIVHSVIGEHLHGEWNEEEQAKVFSAWDKELLTINKEICNRIRGEVEE